MTAVSDMYNLTQISLKRNIHLFCPAENVYPVRPHATFNGAAVCP